MGGLCGLEVPCSEQKSFVLRTNLYHALITLELIMFISICYAIGFIKTGSEPNQFWVCV